VGFVVVRPSNPEGGFSERWFLSFIFFICFLFSETDAVQNGLHLINLLLYFRRLRQFYVIGDQFSGIDVGIVILLAELVGDVPFDELFLLFDLFVGDLTSG
jgi:hypothetical protein